MWQNDHSFSRKDMITLFKFAANEAPKVSAHNLGELRSLVAYAPSARWMANSVGNLSNKVVNYNKLAFAEKVGCFQSRRTNIVGSKISEWIKSILGERHRFFPYDETTGPVTLSWVSFPPDPEWDTHSLPHLGWEYSGR